MSKQAQKPKLAHDSVEAKHSTSHTGSVNGSLTDIQSDVFSTLWKDLLSGGGKNVSEQVFGAPAKNSGGHHELQPGKPASLKKSEKAPMPARSEGHMEYFRKIQNADINPHHQEQASLERRVDEIRIELRKIVSTSKELESAFKQISVEQKVVKAGTYHETFFTFILSVLRSARIRMEEGASWANIAKGKKGQQGKKQQTQYWSMAKKHGTSFTLNNERTAATQTG